MAVVLEQYKVQVLVTSGSTHATPSLDAAPASGNLFITTEAARWGASGPVSTIIAPTGFSSITPTGASNAQIPNMEAHTAAIAYKIATGSEGNNYSVNWTTGSNITAGLNAMYEFSGLTSPVLDKAKAAGSLNISVTQIYPGPTSTLGASSGLAFLVGLNRLASAPNTLSNDASMSETYDNGVTAGGVGFNMMNAWQEFTSTAEYDVTVSSGSASRMGAFIVTFISSGGTIPSGNATASWGFSSSTTKSSIHQQTSAISWGFSSSITKNPIHQQTAVISWGFSATASGAALIIHPIIDYVIEYRTTNGPGEWALFDDGVDPNTGATVTDLDPSTSYDFRVAAVNEVGQSPWSNIATAISGESSQQSGDASSSWGFSSNFTAESIRTSSIETSWGFAPTITHSTERSVEASNSFGFAPTITHSTERSVEASNSFGFATITTSSTERSVEASNSFGFIETITSESERFGSIISTFGFSSYATYGLNVSEDVVASFGFNSLVTHSSIRFSDISISFGFTYGVTANEVAVRSITFSWGFTTQTSIDAIRIVDISPSWGFTTQSSIDTIRTVDISSSWGFSVSSTGEVGNAYPIIDYVIEYRTTNGPGTWTLFNDGIDPNTGVTVTDLDAGTSYDFRVAAVNALGQGPWSNIATAISAGSSQYSGDALSEWGFLTEINQEATHNNFASSSFGFSAIATGAALTASSGYAVWGFVGTATETSVRDSDILISWGFTSLETSQTIKSNNVSSTWSHQTTISNNKISTKAVSNAWGFTSTISESSIRRTSVTTTWSTNAITTQNSIHNSDALFAWYFTAYATTSGSFGGSGSASWSFQASANGEGVRNLDLSLSWTFDSFAQAIKISSNDASVTWLTDVSSSEETIRSRSLTSAWGYTSTTLFNTIRAVSIDISFRFSAWAYAGDASLSSHIFIGSLMISKIYVGQNQVIAGYLGSNKVF